MITISQLILKKHSKFPFFCSKKNDFSKEFYTFGYIKTQLFSLSQLLEYETEVEVIFLALFWVNTPKDTLIAEIL